MYYERDMLQGLRQQWFLWKEHKHLLVWRQVMRVYAVVFVVWAMYRLLFRLPVVIEEVVLKGIVFGGPVLWLVLKQNGWTLRKLGMHTEKLFESVYLGLSLGMVLGLVGQIANVLRYGQLSLSGFGVTSESIGSFLLLGLVTAFWESLLFYGFILQALRKVTDELSAVLVTAVLFVLIHIPALILVQQLTIAGVLLSSIVLLALAWGNGVLYLRMQNLAAPILAHALWGVTVFLFR